MMNRNNNTETELLLIRRWLALLQKHYRLYNIDYSHQCLTGISQSIVRAFRGIDNFFGCVQCGQYHICQQSPNSCYVVNDHQQQRLFCLFSGQLLENCENFETRPVSMQKDNSIPLQEDEKHYNTGTSFRTFGEQSSLYTNIKGGGHKRRKEGGEAEEAEWQHISKKQHREESVDKTKQKTDRVDEEAEELAAEEEEESEEEDDWCNYSFMGSEENNFLSRRTNDDYNYQYWSNYYSFLYEKRIFPKTTESRIMRAPSRPKQAAFNYHIMGANGTEIEKECNTLLERLLLLSENNSEKKEQIFLLLCDYFVPLIKNFYLLIHNSPVIRGVALEKRLTKAGKEPLVMTAKQVTEAVILHLLTESYQAEDTSKNKIQLWVRNPWVVYLNEKGHIAQYYTKYLNKNGNTIERAMHTKNDIKECLSFYFIHCYWLQKFIHTNRRYHYL